MASDSMPLGRQTEYPDRYAPELLYPIDRSENRKSLALTGPWYGVDVWNAYEISWLDARGLPQVAMGRIHVPAGSRYLVESKSLKLYLNSLNQSVYDSVGELQALLEKDLSAAAGTPVRVELSAVDEDETLYAHPPKALVLETELADFRPEPGRPLAAAGPRVSERLCSHLLKSQCPVTGQPDWGTLLIDYRGAALDREALLTYLIGFRQQQDFHEHCVEKIFTDLMIRCEPEALTVGAFYTRRGGLDINPWRSTDPDRLPELYRLRRQ